MYERISGPMMKPAMPRTVTPPIIPTRIIIGCMPVFLPVIFALRIVSTYRDIIRPVIRTIVDAKILFCMRRTMKVGTQTIVGPNAGMKAKSPVIIARRKKGPIPAIPNPIEAITNSINAIRKVP